MPNVPSAFTSIAHQHFHWLMDTETETRTVANGNVKLLWQVCNKPHTQVADRFKNLSAISKFITFHPEEGTSASASVLTQIHAAVETQNRCEPRVGSGGEKSQKIQDSLFGHQVRL